VTDQVTSEFKKRFDKLEGQVKATSLYKRLSQVRGDIESEVDKRRAQVYEVIGVATQDDVDKIHKKLKAISKKLDQLSKPSAQA
jgi:tetrahydromethanopterin S-methyltransferase subunit G